MPFGTGTQVQFTNLVMITGPPFPECGAPQDPLEGLGVCRHN